MNTKYNVNDKVWVPVIYDKKNETYIVVNIYNEKNNEKIKLTKVQSFNIDKISITAENIIYIYSHYPVFENEYAYHMSNKAQNIALSRGFEDIVFTEDIMFDTEDLAKKEIGKVVCRVVKSEFGCCNCKCK